MIEQPRGATAGEWFHFDFVLGLGANLLPCVPAAPDVRVVNGSALEGKVGKIPSQFNANGEAHGLLEWQKRQILGNEVKIWSADRRLNLCVRTGPISGVYAFDVDIEDAERAQLVMSALLAEGFLGSFFYRTRENSGKFLVPFCMEEPCKKRKIKLDNSPKGPAIELLADGQQFVAAGSHSSGSRYLWRPELPTHLPVLTLEQMNQIWTVLTSRFATATSRALQPAATSQPTPSASDNLTSVTTSSFVTGAESSDATSQSALTEISDLDWSQLIAALRFLLNKVQDNDAWSAVGYALLSLKHTRPAEQLWYDFSHKAVGYEPSAPEAWWQQHANQQPRSDYRHIFTIARSQGWGRASDPAVFTPVRCQRPADTNVPSDSDRGLGDGNEESSAETDSRSGGPEPSAGEGSEPDILAPKPEKPIINLIEKDYSEIIDRIETILEPWVYNRDGMLMHLTGGKSANKIERSDDQRMLVQLTKADARYELGKLATWQRWASAKGAYYEVSPSSEHINGLLERTKWDSFRKVIAIARAPFVRPDGTICEKGGKDGYDEKSRVILLPSADFPPVPRNPTREDALGALSRLRAVFHQFPWSSSAAESAFMAHVLSEAARLAMNKCPMFWYSAPDSGTGKTLLQSAASILVHGTVPATRPWVGEADELRKTIYASLLAGDRSLLFDNVPDGVKVRNAELCGALTSTTWKDRKLGESTALAVPNQAVFSASGNNVNPAGDLPRRSLVVRLDANTEKLAERRFEIEDLEQYLIQKRPALLVDALTVVSAYRRTPETDITMPVPLPSFEQWSHLVREPLIWLGMPDPVETQKRDIDDDRKNVADVFALLVGRYGGTVFAAAEIARAAGGISDQGGQLTNALISAGCKEPNSPHDLGYWFRRNHDKIFHGHKLVSAAAHTMVGAKWKFVKVE